MTDVAWVVREEAELEDYWREEGPASIPGPPTMATGEGKNSDQGGSFARDAKDRKDDKGSFASRPPAGGLLMRFRALSRSPRLSTTGTPTSSRR